MANAIVSIIARILQKKGNKITKKNRFATGTKVGGDDLPQIVLLWLWVFLSYKIPFYSLTSQSAAHTAMASSFSSSSSLAVTSSLLRVNSSTDRPWTIVHLRFWICTGNENTISFGAP